MFKSIIFSLIFLAEHQVSAKVEKVLYYTWFHLISTEEKDYDNVYQENPVVPKLEKTDTKIIYISDFSGL